MELLLGVGDLQIDGFLAPGHVSAIIGLKPYELFPRVIVCLLWWLVSNLGRIDGDIHASEAAKRTHRLGWRTSIRASLSLRQPRALEIMAKAFVVTGGNWRGWVGCPVQP